MILKADTLCIFAVVISPNAEHFKFKFAKKHEKNQENGKFWIFFLSSMLPSLKSNDILISIVVCYLLLQTQGSQLFSASSLESNKYRQ